jgi:hypothetical protein
MKNLILNAALLSILSLGTAFAQSYKNQGPKAPVATQVYAQTKVAPSVSYVNDINQLDRIVSLTKKQEKEIKKIEQDYNKMRMVGRKPMSNQGLQRLQDQKEKEILSVLTPVQRQRLVVFERAQYNNKPSSSPVRRG